VPETLHATLPNHWNHTPIPCPQKIRSHVQGLTFSQNTAQGILADAATVYLDRTQVIGNTGGGIALTNGAAGYLRNCFVGGDVNNVAALEATGSSVDILLYDLGRRLRHRRGPALQPRRHCERP